NLADATDVLLGTTRQHIKVVPARSTFYVGGIASLQGKPAIAKGDAVAHVGSGSTTHLHVPKVANVRALPDRDPAWVDSVQGEIGNDSSDQVIVTAQVYAVVLNPNGAIIGGASGTAVGPAPPGARMFFNLSNADAIPTAQVGSIQVSVIPTYRSS